MIASTAHYAKFPETVMHALNIPQGETLNDTVEILKKIKTCTAFHKSLEDIVNKPVIHTEVLEKDVGEIKKSIIKIFSEKLLH